MSGPPARNPRDASARFLIIAALAVLGLGQARLPRAPAIASADLMIVKTNTAVVDSLFRYTLIVTNQGPDASTAFTVTDTLPGDLVLLNQSGAGAACSAIDLAVTCSGAGLSVGGKATINLFARVLGSAVGKVLTNTAYVTGTVADPNLDDNHASVAIDFRRISHAYAPLTLNAYNASTAPPPVDLVALSITPLTNTVQVIARNAGTQFIPQDFWVDLYLGNEPHKVNETFNVFQDGSGRGATWLVPGLLAGKNITLTIFDQYYAAGYTAIPRVMPPGSVFWMQVDSADLFNVYGAVTETHELELGPYDTRIAPVNNIIGPITSAVTITLFAQ